MFASLCQFNHQFVKFLAHSATRRELGAKQKQLEQLLWQAFYQRQLGHLHLVSSLIMGTLMAGISQLSGNLWWMLGSILAFFVSIAWGVYLLAYQRQLKRLLAQQQDLVNQISNHQRNPWQDLLVQLVRVIGDYLSSKCSST